MARFEAPTDTIREQNAITERQLKVAVDATEQTQDVIEAMHLDQRPWLDIEVPAFNEPIVGKRLEMKVKIRNSGKTPAHVKVMVLSMFMDWTAGGIEQLEAKVVDHQQRFRQPQSISIPPNTTHDFTIRDGPMIEKDTEMHLFHGALTVMMAVRLEYTDSRRSNHITERWFISDMGHSAMVGYHKHNQMD